MSRYKTKVLATQIFLTMFLIIIWELLASKSIINTFIFSSPSRIWTTLIGLIQNGELFTHIFITLKEVLISFILGISIAFILSIIMYLNRFLSDVLDPFLTMLNSLPKVALGPIIIIWAGANSNSIIVMALLINVIISTITFYNGFIHTDELRIKLFKTFKANKWQTLFKLVIPDNIPTIVSSLKINISLTFIGVIMGEFLVSKGGIGYLILYGTQVFNLNLVMTGIFILILLSFGLYKTVILLEKKLQK